MRVDDGDHAARAAGEIDVVVHVGARECAHRRRRERLQPAPGAGEDLDLGFRRQRNAAAVGQDQRHGQVAPAVPVGDDLLQRFGHGRALGLFVTSASIRRSRRGAGIPPSTPSCTRRHQCSKNGPTASAFARPARQAFPPRRCYHRAFAATRLRGSSLTKPTHGGRAARPVAFTERDFRDALAQFATGVTVICAPGPQGASSASPRTRSTRSRSTRRSSSGA